MDHEVEAQRLRTGGGYGWLTPRGQLIACTFEDHLDSAAATGVLPAQMAEFKRLETAAKPPADADEWPYRSPDPEVVHAARMARDTCRWDIVDRLYAAGWIRLGTRANTGGGLDLEAEGSARSIGGARADLEVLASIGRGGLEVLVVRPERLSRLVVGNAFARPTPRQTAGHDSFATACQAILASGYGMMSPSGEVFATAERNSMDGIRAGGELGKVLAEMASVGAHKLDALENASKPGADRMHSAELYWYTDRIEQLNRQAINLADNTGWIRLMVDRTPSWPQTTPVLEVLGEHADLRRRGPDLRDAARIMGTGLSGHAWGNIDPWGDVEGVASPDNDTNPGAGQDTRRTP